MPRKRKSNRTSKPQPQPAPPSSPPPFNREDRVQELQSYLEDESYARFRPDIQEAIRLYTAHKLPRPKSRRAVFQFGRMVEELDQVDYLEGIWVEEYPLQNHPPKHDVQSLPPSNPRPTSTPSRQRRRNPPTTTNAAFIVIYGLLRISYLKVLYDKLYKGKVYHPTLDLFLFALYVLTMYDWWGCFWEYAEETGLLDDWIEYFGLGRGSVGGGG